MSGWLRHALDDLRALIWPDAAASQSLPVMDGPWTPNRRLDEAGVLGAILDDCDDINADEAGDAWVSAGDCVWQLSGADFATRRQFARLPGAAGALAYLDGALYVGVADCGVVKLDPAGREVARITHADGRPLRCVTAIAPLTDGRLAITEGSAKHPPARWCHDLLEKGASGRVVLASADLANARTVQDGLAWPAGVMVAPDGNGLWITESWRHAVHRLTLDGTRTPLLANLPAYPARLNADGHGGAWLALMAARTQLVELVLREEDYRREMLATVAPRYWIAPSLQATGHYLEPLQGGALKKLGLVKPWAPPRSYGLVAQLTATGACRLSLHSRAGGKHHGVLTVRAAGERVIALAKGGGQVLDLGPVGTFAP